MKILIYTHDTYGLGNIRRMLSIAEYLSDTLEDVTLLMVSGSPMLQSFRLDSSIDYVKLPTISRTVDGKYAVRSLGMGLKKTIKLRANLIMGTVLDFKPDVILVDKKPLGLKKELEGVFNFLRQRGKLPRIYLVLRDILDAGEITNKLWQKKGYFEAIDDYYQKILVLGSEEIFDVARQYRFPASIRDKLHYCGYLDRSRDGAINGQSIRQQLGIAHNGHKLILVTPGGGADGTGIIRHFLQFWHDAAYKYAHAVVVHGPELNALQRQTIQQLAEKCSNLTLLEFTPDMLSYMQAADMLICMAGYNTLNEALILNKRILAIPRVKPVQEQLIRVRCMAQAGLLNYVHPDHLDNETFQRSFEAVLNHQTPADNHKILSFDGLYQVAQQICPPQAGIERQQQTGGTRSKSNSSSEPFAANDRLIPPRRYFSIDTLWVIYAWLSSKNRAFKEANHVS